MGRQVVPISLYVKYLDFETIIGEGTMFGDLGLLALRLALGAVFLPTGRRRRSGRSAARGWAGLAVSAELAAGFLFLLGLLTPLATLLALATMAVAIAKVHGPKGFFIQNGGGGRNTALRSEEGTV